MTDGIYILTEKEVKGCLLSSSGVGGDVIHGNRKYRDRRGLGLVGQRKVLLLREESRRMISLLLNILIDYEKYLICVGTIVKSLAIGFFPGQHEIYGLCL